MRRERVTVVLWRIVGGLVVRPLVLQFERGLDIFRVEHDRPKSKDVEEGRKKRRVRGLNYPIFIKYFPIP